MPSPSAAPAIQARRLVHEVSIETGTLRILGGVDLTVQHGESLAIMGASGSGKSTLLGLLAGLDQPSAGSVHLDGCDLSALSEDQRAMLRRDKVGFVFQSFQLLPHLTALENVMLPLELRRDNAARQRASAMLAAVGLATRASHYPRHLSGGEQQRVAIARAFVTQPSMLLADEPTGSLDAATGDEVLAQMFRLSRDFGSTLVIVTHDEHVAARCDRVVTLHAGCLH